MITPARLAELRELQLRCSAQSSPSARVLSSALEDLLIEVDYLTQALSKSELDEDCGCYAQPSDPRPCPEHAS